MDEDPERLLEEAWRELEKALPLAQFIRTWGSLESERWIARLHREPAAQAGLQALFKKTSFSMPERLSPAQLNEIVAFIEAHPTLDRHVKVSWRIQLAHMMRAAAFGGENLSAPRVKSKEWKALFDRLSSILKRHGEDNAFGEGDFFLVDDEVGEPGHKLEVRTPDILRPALIQDLQGALKGWQNEWYVVITLDFDHADLDPGMMVVWVDRVDEAFDRAQLKSVLGPRFAL